jgi:hypothetical protein
MHSSGCYLKNSVGLVGIVGFVGVCRSSYEFNPLFLIPSIDRTLQQQGEPRQTGRPIMASTVEFNIVPRADKSKCEG